MKSPYILVESVYGSTQEYATELAKRTHGATRPLDTTFDLAAELASEPAPVIVIVVATLTAIPLIDGDPFATWMLLPLALCACAAAFIINARRGKESPPVDWS